jgi:hypothetical protein
LKWLQADAKEPNAQIISDLSDEATVCELTAARPKERAPDLVADSLRVLQLETGWVDIARQRAASIIQAVTPSRFAPEERGEIPDADEWIEIEPELRPPRIENPATRYGIWWHEFVQKIPWLSEGNAWHAAFEASLCDSPEPARSKREWKLLTKYASEHPEFFAGNIFAEMPFFWRMDKQKCLEGLIDVALFQPDEKKWFVLDWKTNRIERDEIDKLRVAYRPQIAAYWTAVTEITKRPVSAGIYSTATGDLIVYNEKELADEWERLSNLPADDLLCRIGDSR